MTYDGGKNADGVWHQIINQMLPHDCYVELFTGSAGVGRRKRPASKNIFVEKDPETLREVKPFLDALQPVQIFHGCAIEFLERHGGEFGPETLIYADPPYLRSTRSSQRDLYRFEFASEAEHGRLLELAKLSKARWIISGYFSEFYRANLPGWRTVNFLAGTRGGARMEYLWCNFPEPCELHDYRFLGSDRTDRQRIKRKMVRWASRLRQMPALERNVIFGACDLVKRETSAGPGVVGNGCDIAQTFSSTLDGSSLPCL